jgi:hypothetical protein
VSDYAKSEPATLNITYIPVDMKPSASEDSDLQWFGKHYDLSRAKAILRSQKLDGVGPYIVTSGLPLTGESGPMPKSSVIDLSAATEESMALWIAQFVKVSESPEDWLSHGADWVALKVHDLLALVGESAKGVVNVLPDGRRILKAIFGG